MHRFTFAVGKEPYTVDTQSVTTFMPPRKELTFRESILQASLENFLYVPVYRTFTGQEKGPTILQIHPEPVTRQVHVLFCQQQTITVSNLLVNSLAPNVNLDAQPEHELRLGCVVEHSPPVPAYSSRLVFPVQENVKEALPSFS